MTEYQQILWQAVCYAYEQAMNAKTEEIRKEWLYVLKYTTKEYKEGL